MLSLRQHKGWTYASVNGCVLSLRQHKGWTYASINERMLGKKLLKPLKGPNQGQPVYPRLLHDPGMSPDDVYLVYGHAHVFIHTCDEVSSVTGWIQYYVGRNTRASLSC